MSAGVNELINFRKHSTIKKVSKRIDFFKSSMLKALDILSIYWT